MLPVYTTHKSVAGLKPAIQWVCVTLNESEQEKRVLHLQLTSMPPLLTNSGTKNSKKRSREQAAAKAASYGKKRLSLPTMAGFASFFRLYQALLKVY